jgi:membrane protein implicated in regulation of membrane protease activity
MTESSSVRVGVVAFVAILTVSAGTMLYLFWRFPLTTAIVTLGVLAALGVLARLARSIDEMKDLDRREQSI